MNSNLAPDDSESDRERRFFSNVSRGLIRALYGVYKQDFEMFGYGRLETYLGYAPAGFASFRQAIPLWTKQKLL